ncbi:hypothetical protein ACIP79_41680 [Streptomyces sp. NPDC088747]|uniref:hypothetical protein n=1 Tax=Streptomyces sp. NPDC088747 TaxID=3365886 RepID=UPI00380116BC
MVQAVGTDAWAAVRHQTALLLGRGDAERQQAELQRLDQTEAGLSSSQNLQRPPAYYWEGMWRAHLEEFLGRLSAEELSGATAELDSLVRQFGTPARAEPTSATHGGLAAGKDVSVRAEGGSVAGGVLRVDGGIQLSPPFPRGPQQ